MSSLWEIILSFLRNWFQGQDVVGDSALLSYKGKGTARAPTKHKAGGNQSNLDRSHGQVEALPLRL